MAASIAFQATDTDGGTLNDNGTYTFALTVASAAGQERLIAVAGIGGPFGTVDFDALTCDGQTGTRVGAVSRGPNDGGGVCAFATFYRAAGTSGTTINVVATANCPSGNVFSGYCAVWSLNDADTVTATTNTAVNDPTLSTNTTTGGAAAAVVFGYSDGAGPTLAWTGLTEVFDAVRVFGDEVFSGASAAIVTGETPRAISADLTPDLAAGGDSVAGICVSFAGDVVAGGNIPEMMHQYRMRRR